MRKTLEVHYVNEGATLGIHDTETGETLRIEVDGSSQVLADKIWALLVPYDHRNPNTPPEPAKPFNPPWPGSWEPQRPEDVGL